MQSKHLPQWSGGRSLGPKDSGKSVHIHPALWTQHVLLSAGIGGLGGLPGAV